MLDAIDIGYAIKDRRLKLGLTQAQLAKAAGVSSRCLWSLELGQNSGVQLNKLTAVFEVLGLDLSIVESDTACTAFQKSGDRVADTPSTLVNESLPKRNENSIVDALAILTGEQK